MELSVGLVPRNARGLRVLLVDNDTTTLMYMASILEEHSYKVTTTELPSVALSMIRDRKGQYDLVIAEVNMAKMNGFVFLEQILPQVDVPIILTSVDPKGELARKALDKGACFFFGKPIPTRNLVNVWQHVFRKKRRLTTKTEKSEGNSISPKISHSLANIQHLPIDRKGKRKIIECEFVNSAKNYAREPQRLFSINGNQEEFNRTREDNGKRQTNTNNSSKNLVRTEDEKMEDKEKKNTEKTSRLRVKWTPELHFKFMEALTSLGDKKPNPKAVLKLMDVPYLTHRHVASHLQKYRERIKRISSNCENNPPMQTKATFNFYGENKSKSSPIPVTMASQSSGSSVHYTLETLKRQLQAANCNTNNTPQNGVQDNGKGKQPLEPEGQYGDFASFAAPVNVNKEVHFVPEMDPARGGQDPTRLNGDNGGVGVKLDIDELIKMLEEDDEFEDLGESELMGEDSEIFRELLMSSSSSGFDDDFSSGSVA